MTVAAMYPGTFDPITLGHEDLVRRAAGIFERVVVAIAADPGSDKSPMFSIDERVDLARVALTGLENVEVRRYGGLTVDFATENELSVIVRGLRAVADGDNEPAPHRGSGNRFSHADGPLHVFIIHAGA